MTQDNPHLKGLATHVVFALLHLLPSNKDSYSLYAYAYNIIQQHARLT
jgi:hypothetical protein